MRASRTLRATVLLSALALGACGGKDEAATPAAPAPTATPAQPATPAAADPAPAASPTETAPATTDTPVAADAAPAATPAPAAPAPAEPVAPPTGPAPRLGTDYFVIDPAQPLNSTPGRVEIAEVFSYTCIHCARLDPMLPAWKPTLPAQVDFVEVPMSHGAFEPFARGFHAAAALGKRDATHTAMFKAVAEEQRYGKGTMEDIAGLYADQGIDEAQMLATMKSFGVTATINRTRKALERWAIEGTPSLVVAGKYRVVVTGDRGHQGMLESARWLAQQELSQAGTNAAP